MQQEKEKALEAIRSLIAYYISDFQKGRGYTGKQQLIYLTPPQAEEMWRRVLESGNSYKAISIMGEYVEFDEAYPSTAALKAEGLRGDLRV